MLAITIAIRDAMKARVESRCVLNQLDVRLDRSKRRVGNFLSVFLFLSLFSLESSHLKLLTERLNAAKQRSL